MPRMSKENGNVSPAAPGSDKLEKLKAKRALLLEQIRAEEAARRKEQREFEDHKKFSVGGHFLPLIEEYASADTETEINLTDEQLAKVMLAHMRKNMNTAHHRKVLGLPPLPKQDQPANDPGTLKSDFAESKKA